MEGTNLCICGYLSTEIGNQKDKEDPFSTEWQLQIECGNFKTLTDFKIFSLDFRVLNELKFGFNELHVNQYSIYFYA